MERFCCCVGVGCVEIAEQEKDSTLEGTLFLWPYKLCLVYFTSSLYYCVFVISWKFEIIISNRIGTLM
jgi:hypothetical protein